MYLKKLSGILFIFLLLSCNTANAKSYQCVDSEKITGICTEKYNPPAAYPQIRIDTGNMFYIIPVTEDQFNFIRIGCQCSCDLVYNLNGKGYYKIKEI